MSFTFSGKLSVSKSLMNRALICQSFSPTLKLIGDADCDDVLAMRQALHGLPDRRVFDAHEAGTTFRFLALRLSREPGRYRILGTERLLARPQSELARILKGLGVEAKVDQGLVIESNGWTPSADPLEISLQSSSQFASAVLLSAWGLPFDLTLKLSRAKVSESYWSMTKKMVSQLGMILVEREDLLIIPAGQKIRVEEFEIEVDMSSLFSLSACALLGGSIEVENYVENSLQPDHIFLDIFRQMGVEVSIKANKLALFPAKVLRPVQMSFEDSPDLFPVMAALCCFVQGKSFLKRASHLVFKESDRYEGSIRLLRLAGATVTVMDNGLEIDGQGLGWMPQSFEFDPDSDHRMAMAAAVFGMKNRNIWVHHPEVVKKSFPEFWTILGESSCRFS